MKSCMASMRFCLASWLIEILMSHKLTTRLIISRDSPWSCFFVLVWYSNLVEEIEKTGLISRHETPVWFIE